MKPTNVSYDIASYSDSDNLDDFIESDLDALLIKSEASKTDPNGVHKLIKLEFSLPSSAYATMALRELMTDRHSHIGGDSKTGDTDDKSSDSKRPKLM